MKLSKFLLKNIIDKEINIEWKDIYIGKELTNYEVNNIGEVRNKQTKYVLKNQEDPRFHYLRVEIPTNENVKKYLVHRLVAKAFIPNPENKPCINHIDFNRQNNRVENLEWVTYKENTNHAIIHNHFNPVGINNPSNIYSEEIVHQICKFLEDGVGPNEISRLLNVNKSLPKSIKRRKIWRHISSQYNIPLSIKKNYSIETIHKVCQMIDNGYNKKEISNILNINESLVKHLLWDNIWPDIANQYNFKKKNK